MRSREGAWPFVLRKHDCTEVQVARLSCPAQRGSFSLRSPRATLLRASGQIFLRPILENIR